MGTMKGNGPSLKNPKGEEGRPGLSVLPRLLCPRLLCRHLACRQGRRQEARQVAEPDPRWVASIVCACGAARQAGITMRVS